MLGKPVRRGQTPDGMDLVLWDHDNDDGYSLMTYPVAKGSSESPFGPQKGKVFCCPLIAGVKEFLRLEKGETDLYRLKDMFYVPDYYNYI